jgi:hypothetical protein
MCGAASWLGGFGCEAVGGTPHPIGLITNTVRKELQDDFESTYRALAQIGYREIETGRLAAKDVATRF